MSKVRRARKENTPPYHGHGGYLVLRRKRGWGVRYRRHWMGGESVEKHLHSLPALTAAVGNAAPVSCRKQGARLGAELQDKRTWKQELIPQIPSVFLKCAYRWLYFSLFFYIITWGQNIAETGHFRAVQWSFSEQYDRQKAAQSPRFKICFQKTYSLVWMPEYRKAALPYNCSKANGVILLGHRASSSLPTPLLLWAGSGGHRPLNKGTREKVFLSHFKENWILFWILVLLPDWPSRNSQSILWCQSFSRKQLFFINQIL